jgi:hypothetical protein
MEPQIQRWSAKRKFELSLALIRGLQATTTAERRGSTRRRRSLSAFEAIHTQRSPSFNVRALSSALTLDAGCSPAVAQRFRQVDQLHRARHGF